MTMRLGSAAGAGASGAWGKSSSASPESQNATYLDKAEQPRLELTGIERRHVDALADQRSPVAAIDGDAGKAGPGTVIIGVEQGLQAFDIVEIGDVQRR